MACGCNDSCTCILTAGSGITIIGNGNSGSPYVISSNAETPFTGNSSDSSITIVPAGTNGHNPDITLNDCTVFDDSTTRTTGRLMIFSQNGTDCYPERLVDPSPGEYLTRDAGTGLAAWGALPAVTSTISSLDTDTVDLNGDGSGGNPLTANVRIDPAACNRLDSGVNGLFSDGDTSALTLTAGLNGTLVTVPATALSSNSWVNTFTNNEACDVLIEMECFALWNFQVPNPIVNDINLDAQAFIDLTAGATIGGVNGGVRSSVNAMDAIRAGINNQVVAGEGVTFSAAMGCWFVLAAGGTATIATRANVTNRSGITAATPSFGFQTRSHVAKATRLASSPLAVTS